MNIRILFFFVVFVAFQVRAQNLVMNPSFEENSEVDRDIKVVKFWHVMKVGGFYIHDEADSTVLFPMHPLKNVYGKQEPNSGKAYLAIYLVDEDAIETSCLIQGYLTKPLKAGQKYYTEYYLSLSDNAENATSDFYIFFSDSAFSPKSNNAFYQSLTPDIANDPTNFITDRDNWTKMSGTFTAKGGERYMLMGNHTKKSHLLNPDLNEEVIYYLDDLLIKEIYEVSDSGKIERNEVRYFKNLHFETDKSVIL